MAKTDRQGIKNYSTTIAVEKTVAEIERLLVKHGVKQVFKEYDNNEVVFLSFGIEYKNEIIPIRLSTKVDEIKKRLTEHANQGKIKSTYRDNIEQARRVSWRIMLDWIDSQLVMVELGQREIIEVFLADVVDLGTKETLFQKLTDGKGSQFLLDFKTNI